MNQIVSIFILVLVISVLAGLTFLFGANMMTQVGNSDMQSSSITNETLAVNDAGSNLAYNLKPNCQATISQVLNATNVPISSGNYTLTGCTIKNTTNTFSDSSWNISYSAKYYGGNAYNAVNNTIIAGYNVVSYLGLIFLVLIFSGLLALVLRMVIPYLNLGQSMNTF